MSQNQPPMPPQGYPQQPYPPQPPKKKHTVRNIVLIVIAVIVLIGVVRCAAGGGDSSSSTQDSTTAAGAETTAAEETTAEETSATRTVTMTATASGAGTVIWGTLGSTNTEQFTGSWTNEVEVENGETMTLSVSGDAVYGDDSQEMSCEIAVDGEVKESNKATGQMGSASCTVIVGIS